MRIAIIPARMGSKRIKTKNTVDFFGKPMIAYALEAAEKADLFDKIHVSTESEAIRDVVQGLGYGIDFLRPSELADDFTGLTPVIRWVIEAYRRRGLHFEDICCLMPAAPLLEPEDIVQAYNLYVKYDRKHPLHVVAKFPVPLEWAYYRDNEGFLTPVVTGGYATRSQDLKEAYYETGPFSFFHVSHVLGDQPAKDKGFISLVIPRDRAIDIDNPEDLRLAEALYLGKQAREQAARDSER